MKDFHLPKSPVCLLRHAFKLRTSFNHSADLIEGKGLEVEDVKISSNSKHFRFYVPGRIHQPLDVVSCCMAADCFTEWC